MERAPSGLRRWPCNRSVTSGTNQRRKRSTGPSGTAPAPRGDCVGAELAEGCRRTRGGDLPPPPSTTRTQAPGPPRGARPGWAPRGPAGTRPWRTLRPTNYYSFSRRVDMFFKVR